MAMSNAEVQALPLNQVRDQIAKIDQSAKVSGAAAAASARPAFNALSASSSSVTSATALAAVVKVPTA